MSWKVTGVLLDVGEGFIAVGGDGNCLVVEVEVASISVGPNIGPQELCVKHFLVDEGGEDVQVVVSGMEANKDDSISGSECKDNCLREIGAVGWECHGDRHKDLVRGESGD
jgi:hypothetical protein